MSLCVPIAGCNAMMRYEQNKLAMSMRARLVRHVHDAYLDSRSTFYRMHSLGQGLVSIPLVFRAWCWRSGFACMVS